MNIKQLIGLFLIAISLWSCSSSSTETVVTNVAQLNSYYLASNDTFPGFAEAVYVVEQGESSDTGWIYSKDSIRFGTPIERAVPRYVFEATPGYVSLSLGDTTIALKGSDTIDLTIQPMYMTIYSSDLTVKKTYSITTLIHLVDPDLYQWVCLTDHVYGQDDSEQQVVVKDNLFYLFKNNGYVNELYISSDGSTWATSSLSGLPNYCRVKGIVSDGETLYYARDSLLYTSKDAMNWQVHDYRTCSFKIHTMLLAFNDTMWSVVEDKTSGSLYMGKIVKDTMVRTDIALDNRFPISGFCAVEFSSSNYRRRAMVVGGYTREGECVNSRWNFEFVPSSTTPYRIVNYTIEQPTFTTLTGVSVVWYGNQLLMFGGVDKDMQYMGNEILYSKDEGFNWYPMDSTKCALPSTYTARQKQSVVVYDNNLYVVGGQDKTRTYSDVYKGRLNSIDWEE